MTSDPADLERARAAPTEPGEPGDPEPTEAPPGTGRSWVKVSAVAMAVAVVFVAVRLLVPAHGDISRFVVAGSTFADKSHTPSQLHVFPTSDGYDGQFVWRMAADPAYLHTSRHLGMALDSPLRLQRIGYPALAWVLSWGNLALLPWALVVVNLVAIGAVSGVGAVIARDAGRSPWFGLLLAAVPGFAMTLSRDLTELCAVALLVGGLLAARRGRWWLVAGLWSFAVLTREQVVFPIAAYGLWRLWQIVRRRVRFGPADAAWLVPALAYAAWQVVVLQVDGHLPARSGVGANFGLPLAGLVSGVSYWVSHLPDGLEALYTNGLTTFEFAVLVGVVGAALLTPVPGREGWEKWMVVALALLGVTLTRQVWDVPADIRTLADLSVLAWVVLITWGRSRWLVPLASVQTIALAGAMAIRMASI